MRKEFLRIVNGIKKGGQAEQLHDFQMTAYEGEVTLVVGSRMQEIETLSALLQGQADFSYGTVFFHGKKKSATGEMQFLRNRIVRLADNCELSEQHTIADNLFVLNGRRFGEEPFFVQEKRNAHELRRLLEQFGLDVPCDQKVCRLNRLQRYQIRLLKLYCDGVQAVLLDQRMMYLASAEMDALYRLIDRLKRRHMTFIALDYVLPDRWEQVDSIAVVRQAITCVQYDTAHIEPWQRRAVRCALEPRKRRTPFRKCPADAAVVLTLHEVSTARLRAVSLRLRAGEIAFVESRNYEQEQELYQLLCGDIQPQSGWLALGGQISSARSRQARMAEGILGLDRVPVEQNSFFNLTVFDNYCLKKGLKVKALWWRPRYKRHLKKELDTIFGRKIADQPLSALTPGEMQKLHFISCRLAHPKVLVCLNPFSSMDIQTGREAEQMIQQIADIGVGVLILSRGYDDGVGGATYYKLNQDGIQG